MIFMRSKNLFLLSIFSIIMIALSQEDDMQIQLRPIDFISRGMDSIVRGDSKAMEDLFNDNNAVMQLVDDDFESLLGHSEDIEERIELRLNETAGPCRSANACTGTTSLVISTLSFITAIPVTVLCARGCNTAGWSCVGGIYGLAVVGAGIGIRCLCKYVRNRNRNRTIVSVQPVIRALIQSHQDDHVSTDETSSDATNSSDED